MNIVEVLIIGIGLAMDAFAVSICKGLYMKSLNVKKTVIIGLYFGIFQAVMPIVGFLLGKGFEEIVVSIDHWIAFGLLSIIGINMIRDMFEEENNSNDDVSFKTMVMLAIATSIDALAVRYNFCFFTCKYYDFCKRNWCNNIYNISIGCCNWQQVWQQI